MISSDRLSLFTVATGPRGSGKTLLMTSYVCERLVKSWYKKVTTQEVHKVFTNYPVGFTYYPTQGAKGVYLQSEPLNMDALYLFDKGLYNCWVFIDEIDQWADRQEWAAVTQKLLTASAQMIRKRKMTLFATIQDFDWLNSRLRFQTDIIARCRDAAFSSWGRHMHLDLGEACFTEWIDKSGVMTGYTFDESRRVWKKTFWGKRFWGCYNTQYEFDPLEAKTRYKLKLPTKEIVVGGRDRSGEDSGSPVAPFIRDNASIANRMARVNAAVSKAVGSFQYEETIRVLRTDFYSKVNEIAGENYTPREISAAMAKLGVRGSGGGQSYYDLYPLYEGSHTPVGV